MADHCDHAFLEYSLTHEVYVCIHCGLGDWPRANTDDFEQIATILNAPNPFLPKETS